jgi:hypothetical protein
MNVKNIFANCTDALHLKIEPKLHQSLEGPLQTLCFYVVRNSKMTTTAGHSFYIGPIGSFYYQVNDTGS